MKTQKPFSPKQIHILNVAEELIAQNGFEQTSVREISKKANINVAMISYYFGSKEKMMTALYEYRVQRSREKFSELVHTIRNAKPEAQMRAIIDFVIEEVLKYKHFHGFVNQEMKHSEAARALLTDFYLSCVKIIEKIIEKGFALGTFNRLAKAEDLLATIVGVVLFTIRNRPFYESFLQSTSEDLSKNIELRAKEHLYNCVFSVLGYKNS